MLTQYSRLVLIFGVLWPCCRAIEVRELPTLSNDNVVCFPTINITIPFSYLSAAGFPDVDRVILVNDTTSIESTDMCTAQETDQGFLFELSKLDDCLGENETSLSGAELKLTYFVRIIPQQATLISRDIALILHIYCTYDVEVEGNLTSLLPASKNHNTIVDSKLVNFEAEMNLYSNNDFTDKITGPTVPETEVLVQQKIFVGVSLIDAEENTFVLQALICWATATSDPESPQRYDIINDGCPVNDALDDGDIQVKENFLSIHAYFSFKAFAWLDLASNQQKIWLHCSLAVCDKLREGSCASDNPCVARRKRSSPEVTKDGKLVSIGPISVRKPIDDVSANDVNVTRYVKFEPERNGCMKDHGCSFLCARTSSGEPICICPILSTLGDDGKTCYAFRTEDIDHFPNWWFNLNYLPVYAAIVTMVTCIVMLLHKIEKLM